MPKLSQPFWSKFGKDKICGITHVRLRPGKNKEGKPHVVFLHCSHGFYRKALNTWIEECKKSEKDVVCPMCRARIG